MQSKSRRTEIIAHCGFGRLLTAFPEFDETEYWEFWKNGEKKHEVKKGYTNSDLAMELAIEAGYTVKERTERIQDKNYINIDGAYRRLSYKGERKTAITFESHYDEAEHYAEVDKIVYQLAQKDIAVLRGECEITITTRC